MLFRSSVPRRSYTQQSGRTDATQCAVEPAHRSFTKPWFAGLEYEDAPGIRNVLQQFAPKDAERRASRSENIRLARRILLDNAMGVNGHIGRAHEILALSPYQFGTVSLAECCEVAVQALDQVFDRRPAPAEQTEWRFDQVTSLHESELAILPQALERAQQSSLRTDCGFLITTAPDRKSVV